MQAARDLLEKEYYDIAASRAYNTVFYASSALLLSAGIDPSKHSGVIAAIHREFVKTGKKEPIISWVIGNTSGHFAEHRETIEKILRRRARIQGRCTYL